MDKTLNAVIAAALIAASLVSPSFSFAQSPWMARVESAMRQTLPKEAKCIRAATMSICEFETPKINVSLTGSFDDASATVTMRPPLTQEESNVATSMVYGFLETSILNYRRYGIVLEEAFSGPSMVLKRLKTLISNSNWRATGRGPGL